MIHRNLAGASPKFMAVYDETINLMEEKLSRKKKITDVELNNRVILSLLLLL